MAIEELKARAEEIRRERIERSDKCWAELLNAEVEKVYGWILDIIQEKNYKELVSLSEQFTFYMYDDQNFIQHDGLIVDVGKKLDLYDFIFKSETVLGRGRKELFKKLKTVVESVEGYEVKVDYNGSYYDSKAILFEITIV